MLAPLVAHLEAFNRRTKTVDAVHELLRRATIGLARNPSVSVPHMLVYVHAMLTENTGLAQDGKETSTTTATAGGSSTQLVTAGTRIKKQTVGWVLRVARKALPCFVVLQDVVVWVVLCGWRLIWYLCRWARFGLSRAPSRGKWIAPGVLARLESRSTR